MSADGSVRPSRVAYGWAALLTAAVCLFVAGAVWSVLAPGASYVWGRSMVSDMGALTCAEKARRWICSPRHATFNAAQVGAGLLMIAAAVVPAWTVRGSARRSGALSSPRVGRAAAETESCLASGRGHAPRTEVDPHKTPTAPSTPKTLKTPSRRAPTWTLRAASASAGLGLVGLGVFPSDVAHPAHMASAVVALPVSSAFLLADGIRARGGAVRTALGAVALGLSAVHLFPGDAWRGVAEFVSLTALCLAFLHAAWRPARGA